MYEFRPIDATSGVDNHLPSVAMTYDGNVFEELIDGYRTLRVNGRETTALSLEEQPTTVGGIVTGQNIGTRTLTVTFQLIADTHLDFQEKFKQLMKLLYRTDDVQINFRDDSDTLFFGRFTSFDEIPDDNNTVVGTFSIHCQDPFKYTEPLTTNGEVLVPTYYRTVPDLIELTKAESGNVIEITNGEQTIRINGEVNGGSTVVFDIPNQRITVNDVESTYMLALNSDFENFYVKENQTVRSPQGNIKLKVRERWL